MAIVRSRRLAWPHLLASQTVGESPPAQAVAPVAQTRVQSTQLPLVSVKVTAACTVPLCVTDDVKVGKGSGPAPFGFVPVFVSPPAGLLAQLVTVGDAVPVSVQNGKVTTILAPGHNLDACVPPIFAATKKMLKLVALPWAGVPIVRSGPPAAPPVTST